MKKKYMRQSTGILCALGVDDYWEKSKKEIKDDIRFICDIPEMEGIENLIFELGLSVVADAFDELRK